LTNPVSDNIQNGIGHFWKGATAVGIPIAGPFPFALIRKGLYLIAVPTRPLEDSHDRTPPPGEASIQQHCNTPY
jgi:hypothetical protein